MSEYALFLQLIDALPFVEGRRNTVVSEDIRFHLLEDPLSSQHAEDKHWISEYSTDGQMHKILEMNVLTQLLRIGFAACCDIIDMESLNNNNVHRR